MASWRIGGSEGEGGEQDDGEGDEMHFGVRIVLLGRQMWTNVEERVDGYVESL